MVTRPTFDRTVGKHGTGARRALTGALWTALLGLVFALSPPLLELDEAAGLEVLFAARGPRLPPADVAVISISKESAAGVGQSSELDEWPRSLHAKLVDALLAAGARLVVFDVIFAEPRDHADDDRFAEAIGAAGNVVLVEGVGGDAEVTEGGGGAIQVVREERRPPLPAFGGAALATALFTLPTVPQRVAQFWTFGRTGTDPSLPVVALQGFLLPLYDDLAALLREVRPELASSLPKSAAEIEAHRNLDAVMRQLRSAFLEDRGLAAALAERARAAGLPAANARALDVLLDLYAGPDSRYLNYYGPPRTLRTIPYDRALRDAASLDLAGKVLFVGFSERRQPEQQDVFQSVYSQRSGAVLSGVEIGATGFANLLEGTAIRPLPMPGHLWLVLGWGIVLGGGLSLLRTGRAVAAGVIAAGAYATTAYWLFAAHGIWLPLLAPLLAQIPTALVATASFNHAELKRQTERIQGVLGYYVPASAVKALAGESAGARAERQLVHGTCLFTDAEKYATASDALPPEQLLALLNDYYGVMFPIVRRYGGYVSETAGDSMIAVWTSSSPDLELRRSACRAAIEILGAVREFNKDRGPRRLPTRIGIESGDLVLGHVGVGPRQEYRAIGDIITTAARLQALGKVLGSRILISDAALSATGIRARDLGKFLPRGKAVPLRLFEPLEACAAGADAERLDAAFAAALRCFEERRWSDAHRAFAAVRDAFPDDGPAAYYHELARTLELHAPADWPGFVADPPA
ncbi:MAG TPA: adenylate/guanylate cyclase domain-containing protein [Gammaproteobacteria bacterium]|nr:adenylate/guanylate cyclase domain-containing protein [Gammaproteobacteria bacterium]